MEAARKDGELPYTVAYTNTHTLGMFLDSYVSQKIHPVVKSRLWKRIDVRGVHRRMPPAQIFPSEASDRKFNWQRPTAEIVDEYTLQIYCFPGNEYVEHYASLIATYLSFNGQDPSIVHATQPSVAAESAEYCFKRSNLIAMGQVDTVIIGYVEELENLSKEPWCNGGPDEGFGIFAWKRLRPRGGVSAALLGCKVSCWGDTAGYLIEALQQLNQVKTVVYVTKAGTLCPEYPPNRILATGSSSWIDGKLVNWDNVLRPYCQKRSKIIEGVNTTVSSVLVEDKKWLEEWQPEAQWVDCEVGFMANASVAGGTAFGYIHIITDNLAREYEHSLSDEDLSDVVLARQDLFREMEVVIEEFLDQ